MHIPDKKELNGAHFLHKKDTLLHVSPDIEHEKTRIKEQFTKVLQKPAEKIASWMRVLEQTHMSHHEDPRVLERLKKYYTKHHVISSENIPESEYLLEQRIARNLGHGDVEITEEFKEKKNKEIISNQEQSLGKWLEYLTSPDAIYPTWAKYWAFTSLLKMGKLVKEEIKKPDGTESVAFKFKKREKDTAAAFPPLNPRALALAIGAVQEKVEKGTITNVSTKLTEKEFQELVSTEHFAKLYAQFLTELPQYSTEGLRETRGAWVTYPQGSDPKPLVDSLEGYPLEWCTANTETARSQLEGGDFYVYYSLNEDAEPKIPRLAIRMQDGEIGEVRGIAPDQNLDPYIGEVLEAKLSDFPDGNSYKKKSADMKRLTEIEERSKREKALTKEELKFLYEIDEPINGFGYEKDPRIQEIKEGRDMKKDLSFVLDIDVHSISLTKEEALKGGIVFHYGDLNLSGLTSAEGLTLPIHVGGDLSLRGLTSAEGLTLPTQIGGFLDLRGLTSAEGLTLPTQIGGFLDLRGLTSAEGLTLPIHVGGYLFLSGLTSAEGLTLPTHVGGDLYLNGLTSAEGLTLPTHVGALFLNGLSSAEGLTLPTHLGYLDLSGLTSAEGLTLPTQFGGGLSLYGLTSAEGLTLPTKVGRNLDLSRLTSAKGLTLPTHVGGDLYLNGLTSAEGLTLPTQIEGYLNLSGLTSAEGLTLPTQFGGNLYLNGLTSAKGLILPTNFQQEVYVQSLPISDITLLKNTYPKATFMTD